MPLSPAARRTNQGMRLSDLQKSVCHICPLTAADWASAHILGEARDARHRYSIAKTNLGNVCGVMGEITLLRVVGGITNDVKVKNHLLYNIGAPFPVSGADLEFEDGGRTVHIDAKGFDCRTYKQYFTITKRKHEVLRDPNSYYFCFLAPRNSRRALLPALVPHGDVDGWESFKLLQPNDPVRAISLEDFLSRYAPSRFTLESLAALAEDVYTAEEVEAYRPELISYWEKVEVEYIRSL